MVSKSFALPYILPPGLTVLAMTLVLFSHWLRTNLSWLVVANASEADARLSVYCVCLCIVFFHSFTHSGTVLVRIGQVMLQ